MSTTGTRRAGPRAGDSRPRTSIVIPTVGRPSLSRLVDCLATQDRRIDVPVLVVDDRPAGEQPLRPADLDPGGVLDLRVLRSVGGGPSRARNLGWRTAETDWVSFLDDDVLVDADWYARLLADLDVAESEGRLGSQANLEVPGIGDGRPADHERATLGLVDAPWVTADLSYRREALAAVGGFDERFPRAYREDSDLALRLGADRGSVARDGRRVWHPARPAALWSSVRQQAGNADDRLMDRLHGPAWRERAGAPRGRLRRHAGVTVAGTAALVAAMAGRRPIAAVAGALWAAGTAEFAWRRIAPGPRDATEVVRMLLTSMAIPPAAVGHAVAGHLRHRHAGPWHAPPDVVLLDRDGTLVHDVAYNGDPEKVRPVDRARGSLDRLRAAGVRVAVVTNQSGIGRGLLTGDQVDAVNARVEQLLGPFEGFYVCPHVPSADCDCRKPRPGLVEQACKDLGVPPERCVVVGDIGSDLDAARAAGAAGVLVPTASTRRPEIDDADHVAADLETAVHQILGGHW